MNWEFNHWGNNKFTTCICSDCAIGTLFFYMDVKEHWINTKPKDVTNNLQKSFQMFRGEFEWLCTVGSNHSVFQLSAGPNIYSTLRGPNVAFANSQTCPNYCTKANNCICLPLKHTFIRKGEEIIPSISREMDFISVLCLWIRPLSKKAGHITVISLTLFVNAQHYRLQLLRFPICLPLGTWFSCLIFNEINHLKCKKKRKDNGEHVSCHFGK